VAVKDSGGTTLKTYGYDGLHRRISETASDTTTDFYYSDAWQVLEERVTSHGRQSVSAQYVWSPVYVDALVLRDRDTNGDGTLDERLWVVQDANYNVTALVDNSGNVVERYLYDPFGRVTVVDGGWVERSEGTAFAWHYLHQGGRYDDVSGLYHFRYRDYSPTLGRWTSLDPIRYEAGDVNLYRFVNNGPTNKIDPSGLVDRPMNDHPTNKIDPSAPEDRPMPKRVDPGGTFCLIPQSENIIRWVIGPSDKPKLLKDVPFWTKGNPIPALDKTKFTPTVITADRGWSGVIPKGAYIGPDGCGPCVGIALIPPQKGQPVYIMHFSAQANVSKGFEEVGFIRWKYYKIWTADGLVVTRTRVAPGGYEAVICGALMPEPKEPDFKRVNNQRLYTLEDVVKTCHRNGIKIRCFIPTSGFALDENNQIWWTRDPAPSEVERYKR